MCFLSGRKAEQLFGHREVKREVMDMDRNEAIAGLVAYGLKNGLIEEEDLIWAVNSLLARLKADSWQEPEEWSRIRWFTGISLTRS